MKLALIGASGYIGKALLEEAIRRNHEVLVYGHESVASAGWFEGFQAIINCAAFVAKPSVDLNDDHKEKTILGNMVLPAQLVKAANGTPILQISTGCLFQAQPGYDKDGNPFQTKFSETDEPHLTFDKGAGFYVGSKELAERIVRQYEKHWICRMRLPFDRWDNPRNYLTKLLSYPKIVDTYNSLSHRADFVKCCLDMIETGVPFGTYNCTNPGAIWTHQIAHMLTKQGLKNVFEYWNMDDFLKTRKTPMSNAELDVSKLLAAGVRMRTVQEALEDSIRHWTPGLT